jgi:hypothetical protein
VDLEACECVDGGHDFPVQLGPGCIIATKQKGKLRGLPVRQQTCRRCNTVRNQTLSWNGRAVSTSYDVADDYINAARELDSDMHERKSAFRRVLIERALGNAPAEARSA